eukprot:scaffold1835_cov19-Tisochrysis_lutea.AAC.5
MSAMEALLVSRRSVSMEPSRQKKAGISGETGVRWRQGKQEVFRDRDAACMRPKLCKALSVMTGAK